MQPGLRVLALSAALLSTAGLVSPPASSQAFPTRPIKFVVPYTPGASLDIFAREVAEGLRPVLGQSVVVENKPGAGGTVAAGAVIQSPPDGYTLFVSDVGPLAISRAIYRNLPFDTAFDFEPIALGSVVSLSIAVANAVPAKTLRELIALAKAQPGRINYSSSGSGTIIHTAAELFKMMAGVDLQHVPYKGGSPAVTALMTGEVQVGFPSLPTILQLAQAGKLRILAVTQGQRSPLAPDIPTASEAGLPGYEVTFWQAIVAPKGTPKDIIQRLNRDIVAVLNRPEVKNRLGGQGIDVTTSTPEGLGALLRREAEKWEAVARKANIRAD